MTTQAKSWNNRLPFIILIISVTTLLSCQKTETEQIKHGNLILEINDKMQTKISSASSQAKPLMSGFSDSEHIQLGSKTVSEFSLTNIESQTLNSLGARKWTLTGTASDKNINIQKQVVITAYDEFENLLSFKTSYVNKSEKDAHIRSWSNHNYEILNQQDEPSFWAFQGSSSGERADWIRPLESGYYQKNYMGMNNSDYGGGIPVTDIWRSDIGIAIGHLALKPKLISLPTEIPLHNKNVNIKITEEFNHPTTFASGDTISSLETFVMIHEGDYYNALQPYSFLMQKKGIKMAEIEDQSFESIWCSWGYERTFTAAEVLGTLPKVKELGIKWAVLDDGFQIAEGDWNANPEKYANGDKEIRQLVDGMHEMGLKAKIWWTPLAADPGSKALKDRPEMRLFQSDWSPQFITWWDAYYISPVNPHAIAHTKETIDLFMNKWDFDGFKMDGQHMNGVLPDHNPDSQLEYPEQASEGLPDYFQMIYDEARSIKPEAVIENCPCGTCMSFYNMASMNQAVASDPTSLWQIRHKGKTYKALIPHTAYYADHVEIVDTDGKYNTNFATGFGIGAVLGTKFTWPKDNPNAAQGVFVLTAEKEVIYKKWFGLYDELMLSKEKYLGDLYDIGYDKPETHVIQKGKDLYFSFYDKNWNGPITFKGLGKDVTYEIHDYINDVALGQVSNAEPSLDLEFEDYLLVRARVVKR